MSAEVNRGDKGIRSVNNKFINNYGYGTFLRQHCLLDLV